MLSAAAVDQLPGRIRSVLLEVSSVVVRLALAHVVRGLGWEVGPVARARPYATVTDRLGLAPEAPAILVVRDVSADCQAAVDAVTSGRARGILLWDDPEALPGVFAALDRGTALVPHRVIDLAAAAPRLSARQRATLRLIAMGRSNQSIAAAQHQSISTTKRDIAELFERFDAPNRTALLRAAAALGFVGSIDPRAVPSRYGVADGGAVVGAGIVVP